MKAAVTPEVEVIVNGPAFAIHPLASVTVKELLPAFAVNVPVPT